MEYTKDELVIMKSKLLRLLELERKNNIKANFSLFSILMGTSGVAVSLCMNLDKTMYESKSLVVGTCCVAVATMTSLFYNMIKKSNKKEEEEILEQIGDIPPSIADEVYETVYRRR